jgi:hypothetical protein
VLLIDERGTELALLLLPQQQRAGLADIGGLALAVPDGRAPSDSLPQRLRGWPMKPYALGAVSA